LVGTEANEEIGGGQVLRIDPRDGSIKVLAGDGLLKDGIVTGMALIADEGSLLATQNAPQDRILAIDAKSGVAAKVADFGDNIWGIAIDTDGRSALVVSDAAHVAVARLSFAVAPLQGNTLTPWVLYEDPRNYRSVAVRPDGRVFVSFIHQSARKIAEIDRRTHRVTEVVALPPRHNAPLGMMAVEADGNLIVGSYGDHGEIFRVDVNNRTANVAATEGHLKASGGVAVVPAPLAGAADTRSSP
ncbi:MAG: hypothetical protein K8T25_19635, partial [Planctomycetia bacterium]|nr:hypothetical protein [Planctomycetia bacterium]